MCNEFKKEPEVLQLAVTLFHRYIGHLTRTNVPENLLVQVQLVDAASMFVAAKLRDTKPPFTADDLVHYTEDTYTRSELISCEHKLLHALKFDLGDMVLSFDFVPYLENIFNDVDESKRR